VGRRAQQRSVALDGAHRDLRHILARGQAHAAEAAGLLSAPLAQVRRLGVTAGLAFRLRCGHLDHVLLDWEVGDRIMQPQPANSEDPCSVTVLCPVSRPKGDEHWTMQVPHLLAGLAVVR
jgi:hypothetical protein